MAEDEQHISTDRVRGAESAGVVRYVLIAGLGLIVILFALLLLFWR